MNPFLGVIFHWLGGLASGSFYVPFRAVKNWSWETYWLVGGVFSWVICPLLLALCLTNNTFGVLQQQSADTLRWTYFFGLLWGFGGLTFGLTMRYLGMSLGMGIALGYCAAFGTLLPPIFKTIWPAVPVDENIAQIAATASGKITLFGVFVCLVGILIAAYAGLTKEREMGHAEKTDAIAEFNFRRGILVATFSGIMSACFSFALTAGKPMNASSALAGTPALWTGLPKLVVVLLGGFTTNFCWCALLNFKNRSAYEYFAAQLRTNSDNLHPSHSHNASDVRSLPEDSSIPRIRNYFFSAAAGTIWYFQFFFYTMGETQMGKYGFASWTLHMASIIIFSTMWGWIFHEWKVASLKARTLLAVGITTLVLSTIIIGCGTFLKSLTTQ
ncbi:MAG TPA: L-rhamnose/proton symporter RhaT [Pirellulales bacterium]|jgi:L-rhamnose-H+ transport protein